MIQGARTAGAPREASSRVRLTVSGPGRRGLGA